MLLVHEKVPKQSIVKNPEDSDEYDVIQRYQYFLYEKRYHSKEVT